MTNEFSTSVIIDAPSSVVWLGLTDHDLVVKWMGETDMELKVQTDWELNSPVFISGFHHVKFENKGVVLQSEKEKKLSYTHLSSVSHLDDRPENYCILEFTLGRLGKQTLLSLSVRNFPTETIRKHMELYWKVTLYKIKEIVEDHVQNASVLTSK